MGKINVIFDIDDTLLYVSKNAYLKAILVANSLGLEPPTKESFFSVYGRYSFGECVRMLHPGVDLHDYKREYEKSGRLVPYEKIGDVDKMLSQLQINHCGTGILSNGPKIKTQRKLNFLKVTGDIRRRLLFVLHCDNNSFKKPDPRCFDLVFKYIDRAQSGNTYYVGDCLDDYTASIGAGFNFIAVTSGYTSRKTFIEEGLSEGSIIASIREILPYFGI